jgi:hypothetical protein
MKIDLERPLFNCPGSKLWVGVTDDWPPYLIGDLIPEIEDTFG